jgi:hypothetical protein
MKQDFNFSAKVASLAFGTIALSVSALAQADVYGFKFASGAQNLATIKDAGNYIFADIAENLSTPGSDVLFKISSSIPQPVSGIGKVVFDTGSYTSLFSSVSIFAESPGVDLSPVALTTHPYLPGLTPDYAFGLTNGVLYDPRAINPGEYFTVSATLGAGKSFADVISAMNVGINSATASSGLRIGVLAYNLLGTRIDPTKTLMDDAGFVTASIVPVPEAESWALMLAGLGLVGFMAHRRKV